MDNQKLILLNKYLNIELYIFFLIQIIIINI